MKYTNYNFYNANPQFTASLRLYETTGIVDIMIDSKTFSNQAIVGLQNSTKTIGAVAPNRPTSATNTVANWLVPVGSSEAWRFSPPSNYSVTWYANGTAMTPQVTSPSNGYNEFSYAVSPSATTEYSIVYANTLTGCSNAAGSAVVTMDVLSDVAPSGVTTIASDSTVCNSAAFNLSSSYTGSTSGQAYQWQVSTDAGANWTDMAGATASTVSGATQSVVSSYRVGISQCAGAVSYSSPLQVTLNPYQDCYCTPTYTSGTNAGDLISNVEIVGTTLSNNSGFVAGTPAYVNYTGNTVLTAELLPSTSYTVNVSTGEWGSQGFAAWIDYNDDGIFTTSTDPLLNERIGATTGQIGTGYTAGQINASSSFTITLACTPPAGVHRMRVRCAYATNGVNINPCANYGWGETEDYLITIQAAPTCPNPGAMTVPSATTNANDVTLQWLTGCSTENFYDFEYGPAGFTPGSGTTVSDSVTLSITGDTATYLLSGLNSLTDYTVYYRANCGFGDYSAWSLVPTNFTTAPSCFPPSAVTVTNVTTSGATVTWTSNPLSPSADYQYYLSQTNTTPANGVVVGTVDLADTTVTLTGLTSMTTYYMWVRSDCGAGDRSVWTSVATIAVKPCMPSYTSGTNSGDMISFVEITGTTLSNNSGFNAGDPSFEYFAPTSPNLTATMNAGGTYNVNVSTGEWGSQGFAAWIDYNDDGVFTTSSDPLLNERIGATTGQVGTGYTPGEINGSASFTINLGCTPPVGTHRMRVRCAYAVNGVSINPCTNYGYGQTEDYMVTIAPIVPFAPVFTAVDAATCTGNANAVTYSATSGLTAYAWTYTDASSNALVDGVDYSVSYSASSDAATVTWLTAGTKVVGMNYSNPAGCPSTGATSTNTVVTLETVPGSLVFASNAGNTGGTISYNATGAIGSTAGGWQKSIDGGTTWTAIAPNGPNSYTFNNLTVETKFRVLVTNGSCSTLPTNVITGYVPGAGLSNAIQVNTIGTFGTGAQTTYSSNLAGGLDSPQSPGTGLDKWFRFTATENAVRIAVVGSSSVADDNDISLYNAPSDLSSTSPMIPLSTENDVAVGAQGIAADAGSETMVYADLIPGTEYFVSVRNVNATAGTVSVTFSYLRGGAADIMPYTNYTGVYSNTCQNFKAAFRSGSTGYTVNRWATASDLAGGLTPNFTYAIPVGTGTSPATICQLGRIVPANLTGAAIPYYVTVDVTYNVKDAYGNDNIVTAIGRTVTTFTLNAEADLNLRTTDRCPVYKSATSGSVATNRSVCGTTRYEWSFAQTIPTPSLPVTVLGAVGGSRILGMSAIPGIGAGQTYDVQIRSKHFDGVSNTNYGTAQCVRTLGTAGMPTVEDGGVIAERSENGVTTSIYPNPNNGQSVNFAVSGMEGDLNVRIVDATGRMVFANRYVVEGSLNTTIDFGQTLAGGVYMVEMIQNGEMKTMRMVVSK
ncbi:MAG: T9SS type A sorting domain-containing protein [Bacteroidetes bacterium]|nr:T9SS type A sorting domain-containing protein [Bacteroidota bacterium]